MKINDQNKSIQYFQAEFKTLTKQTPIYSAEAVKEISENGTVIAGYASTDLKDRYGDIVDPSAFINSISKEYRKNPIILFGHNHDRPVGRAVWLATDEKGLYVESIVRDPRGEVNQLIKDEILKAFSIGYIPTKVEYQDSNGVVLNPDIEEDRIKIWFGSDVKRILKEVDLVEISIVSVPANPDALFTFEKSLAKYFNSLKPNDMPKDKNLLEKKEDENVIAKEEPVVETPAEIESEKPAETPPAEPETEPTEPKGDEIDAEGEKSEGTEDEVPEADEVEAETEGEAEGDKPEATPEDKSLSPEMNLAVKTISVLSEQNKKLADEKAKLETELAKTPVKQARVVNENSPMRSTVKDGKETTSPAKKQSDDKAGFVDNLRKSAH